ncbi:hypothetical protein AAFF_G00436840 [Aldrovandia affinis]|uniref:Uncharacterized protein n=1 Tax=Aldrovandia affinis TaxID=143900 RepID=A0AAD7S813_9TELE|nr:hypothetical protein AAFF_G00436840 [Aldrovandia affinis]
MEIQPPRPASPCAHAAHGGSALLCPPCPWAAPCAVAQHECSRGKCPGPHRPRVPQEERLAMRHLWTEIRLALVPAVSVASSSWKPNPAEPLIPEPKARRSEEVPGGRCRPGRERGRTLSDRSERGAV